MKIYTRRGDSGETSLLGGDRVPKDDARVAAYGDVDELNSSIGQAMSLSEDTELLRRLGRVQSDLFSIGAALATGDGATARRRTENPALPLGTIDEMERWMDEMDASLPELTNFVLPGGTPEAAALHLARTVARRAERSVVTLARISEVDAGIITYLNRLSDLLFVMARSANARGGEGDVLWRSDG